MIVLAILLILAGVIVLMAGVGQSAQNRSYAACSGAVTATVVRKQSRNVKNGKAHELTVSYTVNGISYEKVVGALLTEFETIAQGDPVELRYKPDNPKKSVRPRELNPRNAQIVYIVGAALAVAGLVLFYMGRMW